MTDSLSLDIGKLYAEKRLLLIGGTGFLGKVWLSLLLHRLPQVGHVFLVVRSRKDDNGDTVKSSEQRYLSEILTSKVFDPLRQQHGSRFPHFIREKITVLDGDVTQPYGGITETARNQLRGTLDAIVNASGVVDFNPPLDKSLDVNAYGMQNLVSLSEDLGSVPFLHTSTCYVAGDRTGTVVEQDPLDFPFPKADTLDSKHWDPAQEITECAEMVSNARRRAKDAFRQSEFLAEAREKLSDRSEPTRGTALSDELKKVERKFIERLLVEEGTERAQFWGWHNIYTYTKSIGEQILRRSSIPHTIVRPAIIESALSFPCVGWNEGINTSAPLIYLANVGMLSVPTTEDSILDVIPVDHVSAGMLISLAELFEGSHQTIYQYGTSASNPLQMKRLIELTSLEKRRRLRKEGKSPLLDMVRQRIEAQPVSVELYRLKGPKAQANQLRWISDRITPLRQTWLSDLVTGSQKKLNEFAKGMDITAKIIDQFLPFTATHNYRFSTLHTDQAYNRLSPEDQAAIPWNIASIDWRHYMLDVHAPGLVENVFPLIEEKKNRDKSPLKAYDHLLDLLDEVAERHQHLPALMRTHDDGFSRISFIELRKIALAFAAHLQSSGVGAGERVYISGDNHPNWAIAYFGIISAGAIAVPLDVELSREQAGTIDTSAEARWAILDHRACTNFGAVFADDLTVISLENLETIARSCKHVYQRPELNSENIASILYTSGTTGTPKGVMLSHGNFTAMLSSLGKVFPLTSHDRVLSVLPLHHTFEFSCGLLLPLSMGTQIIYLDEITGERLSHGLRSGQVTGMIGVPALWGLLERRIRSQIAERGAIAEAILQVMLDLNRGMGKTLGFDLGRLLFAPVHSKLGGNIQYLISGGAALPADTQKFFTGLGLYLSEGYGLTEAAPVLTVAHGGPRAKTGTVGKAIPGVSIEIRNTDTQGVGEVFARGSNVMQGYFNNPSATAESIGKDGWLNTGDMGKVNHKGQLQIVGRAKEVVVTSSGENIYLDDVENLLGPISGLSEYTLVGVSDGKAGERLGLLGVLDNEQTLSRSTHHADTLRRVKTRIQRLSPAQRPSVIRIIEAELPRTRTRKVQRRACAEILERIIAATVNTESGNVNKSISTILQRVSGSTIAIGPQTNLKDELGFDSLMSVELSSALSNVRGIQAPDPDAINHCDTVNDLLVLINQPAEPKTSKPLTQRRIPAPLVSPLRRVLGAAQRALYSRVLKTEVVGRANIPMNRQCIVVSNHCSHLDMGLVKTALGSYGKRLTALAAKDYFFEGNEWQVAYFEQLTNLEPIERKKGYAASLRQAREIVNLGKIVLIFPEGTRQADGVIAEFKPLVGQLSLSTNIDILPLHLEGTFEVLPKGGGIPQQRSLRVQIGQPIQLPLLRPHLEGHRPSMQARIVTKIAEQSITAMRTGSDFILSTDTAGAIVSSSADALQPTTVKSPTEQIIEELQQRFDASLVTSPQSYGLVLNGKGGPRYVLKLCAQRMEVIEGKGQTDCAIITKDSFLKKMIFEAYEPGPPDFISRKISSNNPIMLKQFQAIFHLKESSQ